MHRGHKRKEFDLEECKKHIRREMPLTQNRNKYCLLCLSNSGGYFYFFTSNECTVGLTLTGSRVGSYRVVRCYPPYDSCVDSDTAREKLLVYRTSPRNAYRYGLIIENGQGNDRRFFVKFSDTAVKEGAGGFGGTVVEVVPPLLVKKKRTVGISAVK